MTTLMLDVELCTEPLQGKQHIQIVSKEHPDAVTRRPNAR